MAAVSWNELVPRQRYLVEKVDEPEDKRKMFEGTYRRTDSIAGVGDDNLRILSFNDIDATSGRIPHTIAAGVSRHITLRIYVNQAPKYRFTPVPTGGRRKTTRRRRHRRHQTRKHRA